MRYLMVNAMNNFGRKITTLSRLGSWPEVRELHKAELSVRGVG